MSKSFFGKNVIPAAPGSAQGLYLIVSDIQAARRELLDRGVQISEVFHNEGVYAGTDEPFLFARVSGLDPEHRSYRSFASFRDPDGNGLAVSGNHHAAGWIASTPRPQHLRLSEGSGERNAARFGRPRRA